MRKIKNAILLSYYKLLGRLANRYIKKHKPYIIWINWSVWKTSCRMIITQTLQHYFPHLRISTSSKNFNWELGLSLSIFEINQRDPQMWTFISTIFKWIWKIFFDKKHYDIIILEYGIDRPKEMEFLLHIVKPHIWVFTAIDAVHSEQFGNPTEIAREEVKMVKSTLEIAFLNENDPYAMQVKQHLNIDTFTYQTEWHNSKADITIDDAKIISHKKKPVSEITISSKSKKYKIETNLFGKANYGYIWVAFTIAEIIWHKFGKKISTKHLNEKLEYTLQPGRFSLFEWIENTLIFDSTYNASPLSMKNIINTVWNMRQDIFPKRPLWLVLWDMRELWFLTEQEHRKLAWYISQVADRLFLVGEQMTTHMADELEKIGYNVSNIYKFHSSQEVWTIIKKMLYDKEFDDEAPLLIFKWSQNTIFLEEAVKLLLENPEDSQLLTRQSSWWMKKKGI